MFWSSPSILTAQERINYLLFVFVVVVIVVDFVDVMSVVNLVDVLSVVGHADLDVGNLVVVFEVSVELNVVEKL